MEKTALDSEVSEFASELAPVDCRSADRGEGLAGMSLFHPTCERGLLKCRNSRCLSWPHMAGAVSKPTLWPYPKPNTEQGVFNLLHKLGLCCPWIPPRFSRCHGNFLGSCREGGIKRCCAGKIGNQHKVVRAWALQHWPWPAAFPWALHT